MTTTTKHTQAAMRAAQAIRASLFDSAVADWFIEKDENGPDNQMVKIAANVIDRELVGERKVAEEMARALEECQRYLDTAFELWMAKEQQRCPSAEIRCQVEAAIRHAREGQ